MDVVLKTYGRPSDSQLARRPLLGADLLISMTTLQLGGTLSERRGDEKSKGRSSRQRTTTALITADTTLSTTGRVTTSGIQLFTHLS